MNGRGDEVDVGADVLGDRVRLGRCTTRQLLQYTRRRRYSPILSKPLTSCLYALYSAARSFSACAMVTLAWIQVLLLVS